MSILVLGLMTGCGNETEEFCRASHQGASLERCIDRYNVKNTPFTADKNTCETLADMNYPAAPLNAVRTEPMISTNIVAGRYSTIETKREIAIIPDSQIAIQRAYFVRSCMHKMGWNSAQNWYAGRHATAKCVSGKHRSCKARRLGITIASHKPRRTLHATKKSTSPAVHYSQKSFKPCLSGKNHTCAPRKLSTASTSKKFAQR